jgi:hypothetical protein
MKTYSPKVALPALDFLGIPGWFNLSISAPLSTYVAVEHFPRT